MQYNNILPLAQDWTWLAPNNSQPVFIEQAQPWRENKTKEISLRKGCGGEGSRAFSNICCPHPYPEAPGNHCPLPGTMPEFWRTSSLGLRRPKTGGYWFSPPQQACKCSWSLSRSSGLFARQLADNCVPPAWPPTPFWLGAVGSHAWIPLSCSLYPHRNIYLVITLLQLWPDGGGDCYSHFLDKLGILSLSVPT